MKLGIIIETKEYEKAWNAMRLAVTSKKNNHEVKVFLMGEGVEIENMEHDVYNIAEQVKKFNNIGGVILACGTCMESRNMKETEVCPINTMIDCMNMIEWADKVLTF